MTERERDLLSFFSEDDVYSSEIPGLLKAMEAEKYDPNEWCLFIDSPKRSLKCVLMHNSNKLGSLPIAHSTKVKECATAASVLGKIKYNEHK